MPTPPQLTPSADAVMVSLDEIDDGPNELRLDLGTETPEMADLIESVHQFGVLQAIGVVPKGNRFEQVYGFRRTYAARQAGHTQIPARLLEPFATWGDLCAFQIQENGQRADIEPIRFADVLKKMLAEFQCTQLELARRVSLHPVRISRLLRLADLPDEFKALVAGRQLPVSTAIELSQLDPETQSELLTPALAGELTRDAIAGVRKARHRAAPSDRGPKTNRVTAPLAGGRVVSVAGPQLTLESYIATLEELLAQARRARPSGVSLPTFAKMLKDRVNEVVES